MSKPDRHAAPHPRAVKAPKRREDPKRLPWKAALVATSVVALLAASFVVPGLLKDEPATSAAHSGHQMGTGDGPAIGSRIAFDERNVVTGSVVSSRSLRGHETLLFFSEGVMCQACFQQIRDIESVDAKLEKKGIRLISITPDSPRALSEAIDQYGISTPMISDEDRNMSAAFDTLGQGMHSDTPGHAFVLLDKSGRVVWQRDYWLAPYRTMYVKPATLLADLATAS